MKYLLFVGINIIKYVNRNIEIILAFISFIFVIGYYIIRGMDDKIFLGLLGTIATLYLGAIKHRVENDKLFKELFQDFNSRYDNRINDLINELKYNNKRELNIDERNLIIDYLNLCSEEYLWRSRNRIPKSVWNSWKAGIKENLSVRKVREIYDQEISTKNGKKSFYGLVEELE